MGWDMPVVCGLELARFVGWNMPVACGLELARRLWAASRLWVGACPSLVGWKMPVACGLEYAHCDLSKVLAGNATEATSAVITTHIRPK